MQNKIRQGDTQKAVLINMCLPLINNELLEMCKGEPNNLEQQYWICFFFKRTRAKPIHELQADKSEN